MRVTDYIIQYLADKGLKEAFVVYGSANADLIDSLATVCPDKLKYVCSIHEQGGGFAAEGYAKISENFGCAIATSGPGAMNLVTPIGNCFYDSVPCLFITGQVNSKFMRPSEEIRQIGFQETDIVSIVKSITKYAVCIKKAQDIKYVLDQAFFYMKEGRPGPVLIDIPLDIQKEQIDPLTLVGFNSSPFENDFNNLEIESIVKLFLKDLAHSHRPVILVGGGLRLDAANEILKKVNAKLKIPIFVTWNGIDGITSDYEYFGGKVGTYGGEGRNFGIQNSDLLLALGTRISGRITGGNPTSFAREAKKYLIDIDQYNLQPLLQQVRFDHCLYSNISEFLYILDKYNPYPLDFIPKWSDWNKQVFSWRDKYDPVQADYYKKTEYIHPYVFTRILSEEMKQNDIIVGDCGGNIVILNHAFKTKAGQRYFTNNGNSPMGFSFAAGIGAWFASDKTQNVVSIIGDGGFQMNLQELQTIVKYDVKLKTIIMNNHVYGITKAFQLTNFGGRHEACGPKGYSVPDFRKIVEAYGIKVFTLDGPADLDACRSIIRQLLDYDGPAVLDYNCDEFYEYAPKIVGWNTPIEDMYPYLPEEEFLSNMIVPILKDYKRTYPIIRNKL